DTGGLGYDQVNFNLDLSGKLNWNRGAGPLNVAAGAEWRREGYTIEAGDPVSYQYGRTNNPAIPILNQNGTVAAIGTQGFPGYSPREALDEHRSNTALKQETSKNYWLGLVSKPTGKLRLTVDLYRIDINDRIIFSSNIQPEDAATCGVPVDPGRCPIRAILDPFRVGQVQFFTNA